ncbi:hypothetical protein KCU81_g10084, partial [Aureobasidium melanogenum]|uniref:Uncharacterized protein n=1 Tax=Aureobasidium melanogenum (strain CBS 110374) TaxID=1043003 RepID=A0A074VYE3_AURM1
MSWSFATHWKSEGRVWTLDNSSLPSVDGEPVVLDSTPIPDANDVPPPSSPLRGEPEADGKVDEEDEDEDEEMEWELLPDYSKKFKEKRKKRKEESDDKAASKKVKTAGSVAGAKAANPAKPKASKAAKAAGSAASKKRKADSDDDDDDDDDDENELPAEAMVKIETTSRSGRKITRPQTFSR